MDNHILLTSIDLLPGISSSRAKILANELNIKTYLDLIQFYPYRYVDKTRIYTISEITIDMPFIQLKGVLKGFAVLGTGHKKRLTAIFSDRTGSIELVWFRSIAQIQRMYIPGKEYTIFGKPSYYNGCISINHPEIEYRTEGINTMGLTPLYTASERLKKQGITNRQIREYIRKAIELCRPYIFEPLPFYLIEKYKLMSYINAIENIHYPNNTQNLEMARRRLKFDELLFVQLNLLKIKLLRCHKYKGYLFPNVSQTFNDLYNHKLPFDLTNAQKRVIKEIFKDTNSGHQMNRLVQGDVGCGKTLIAVFSMLLAEGNGYQSCMMAPTEILARQHFESIKELLQDLPIRIEILTGTTSKKNKEDILYRSSMGIIDILIGTHALIEENVEFKNLGLAIIDEQHRFGVEQRSKLWKKNQEIAPHILIMSATPIPRTLAMTLYGDLDISVVDELPPGRKPIQTLHYYEDKMYQVFTFIRSVIEQGYQAYIVYPMIEENETQDIKDLETGYETFQQYFPDKNIAIIHGKMKASEKDESMMAFKEGKIDILLSTTVIEVGVNVPNACLMVIESANRFGLSQLHQLRGRVGRGGLQSYCLLVTKRNLEENTKRRIDIMVETNNGFEIAEEDMKIRGYGDIDGIRQSGKLLSLRIANIGTDGNIVSVTREIAQYILSIDSEFIMDKHRGLRTFLNILQQQSGDWSQIS